MRNTYIYTETKKLIKKYGTRDPFEIMDQMNIVVGETSRYKTLKGYCFMSCKTIYVQNENLDYFGLCSSLNSSPELMSFKLYSLTRRGQAYHMPMEIQSNFLAK